MRSLKLLIITLFMLFGMPAVAGKGAGGQFRFYRSDVNQYLNSAKHSLMYNLKYAPESLNQDRFAGRVDLSELREIIGLLEIRLDESPKTRENPDGYEDILMMDYRVKENGDKYIVALEPLFDHTSQMIGDFDEDMWFHKEIFKEKHLEAYFRRLILHEALHHFGFDEHEAFKLSQLESALAAMNSRNMSQANADSAVYSWTPKYKSILKQLTYWGRNSKHDENPVKIEFPIDSNLSMIIDTSDKKRVAYIKNKKFGSLLWAKCKETRTEQGSVFCEFKKRIVDGKRKSTVSGERVTLYFNNPILGNDMYLDGVYKTERSLRIKYKYQIDDDQVLKEIEIPFFNILEERE